MSKNHDAGARAGVGFSVTRVGARGLGLVPLDKAVASENGLFMFMFMLFFREGSTRDFTPFPVIRLANGLHDFAVFVLVGDRPAGLRVAKGAGADLGVDGIW